MHQSSARSFLPNLFSTARVLRWGMAATLSCAAAHAAVVLDFDYETGEAPFIPSYGSTVDTTHNVLYGLAPSATTGTNFELEGSGGLGVLTDGSVGPVESKDIFATVGNGIGTGAAAGTSITYTLPTPTQLASIAVYGGWVDSGRDEQHFTILYSTDFGETYQELANVENKPSGSWSTPSVVRSLITDDTGLLADGAEITHLQFSFAWPNGVENGWTGLSEIAAYAVIPEPSAALLGLLGSLSLLRRRRA